MAFPVFSHVPMGFPMAFLWLFLCFPIFLWLSYGFSKKYHAWWMIYRESNVAENPNNHNSNGRLGFKEIQG